MGTTGGLSEGGPLFLLFVIIDYIEIPYYAAWVAILIDYLELPVIADLFYRTVVKDERR